MKPQFNLPNLLCTWEYALKELHGSVEKIIDHVANGRPDNAGVRAKETLIAIESMQKNLDKTKKHLCGSYHNGVEKKL